MSSLGHHWYHFWKCDEHLSGWLLGTAIVMTIHAVELCFAGICGCCMGNYPTDRTFCCWNTCDTAGGIILQAAFNFAWCIAGSYIVAHRHNCGPSGRGFATISITVLIFCWLFTCCWCRMAWALDCDGDTACCHLNCGDCDCDHCSDSRCCCLQCIDEGEKRMNALTLPPFEEE